MVFWNTKINYFVARNYNEPGILAVKFVALTLEMAKVDLRIAL